MISLGLVFSFLGALLFSIEILIERALMSGNTDYSFFLRHDDWYIDFFCSVGFDCCHFRDNQNGSRKIQRENGFVR